MITIKDGDLTVIFESPADAVEYAAKRQGYRKRTCKEGAECQGDKNDENHCIGCGRCIHAGMC